MGTDLNPAPFSTGQIATVDASASPEHYLGVVRQKCHITNIDLICATTVATNSSNQAIITVNRIRSGSATQIAQKTTVTTAIAPDTPWVIALDNDADGELSAGDALEVVFTESGTATSGDLTRACVTVSIADGTGPGQ